GFDTRVLANGDLSQQKIEATQGFQALTLDIGAAEAAKPVEVERFSVDVNIINDIDGPINLAGLYRQLATRVTTKAFVGSVAVEGVTPRPLADLQFDMRLTQTALQKLEITDLKARAPDFGSTVNLALDT